MTDKLLLWPLLFDGQLHYVGQDPVVQACSGEREITPSGCGWWATRGLGRGYSVNESDQRWAYDLWRRQETL